jgi:hypothetical protein
MSRVESQYLENKEMNDDVYEMRREVMDIIYEIKNEVHDIPRVEVRVTKDGRGEHSDTLGSGNMGANEIFITEGVVGTEKLRETVYHEVLHGVYAIEHDSTCPLMSPTIIGADKETCQEQFKKHLP